MPQQKIKIPIRKKFKPQERELIAQEVIDYIVNRTKEGRDKNENPFPGYSKKYINSKDFSIAGKSRSPVDLTLTGEMLDSLKLLRHSPGEIVIGYDKGDTELNGKVEGNIKGTYGNSTPLRGKKRDFLGITRKKRIEIQDQYDVSKVDRATILERIARLRAVTGNGEE